MTTISTSSASSCSSSAAARLVLKPSSSPHHSTDLELHLLQAFGAFASNGLLRSYVSAKQASRVLGFAASGVENAATRIGLAALVGFAFAQYQRLGHPLVQYVDEAMGRRIISSVVSLLELAASQQHERDALAAAEHGALTLTMHERVEALLRGHVPRLQALLMESRAREAAASVVVMDLQDFVAKQDVQRLQDESHALLADTQRQVAALKDQVNAAERARQQLEQELTDVHNYQESERGRRFQEMEEELARTKLEASQRAHDLRKLELVIEALRRKRALKPKGSRSSLSIASSDTNDENL